MILLQLHNHVTYLLLSLGADNVITSFSNVDSYIAFFRAGETTTTLHIPVKEVLAGAKEETIPVSLSIPDVSYSLGVRASVWDRATINIIGEQPYDAMSYALEEDEDDNTFFGRRFTRQIGEHK